MYKCNICHKCYGTGKIEVDHVIPIVEIGKTIDSYTLHQYWKRLYDYTKKNLQVACKKCHKAKSKKENEARKELRKKRMK